MLVNDLRFCYIFYKICVKTSQTIYKSLKDFKMRSRLNYDCHDYMSFNKIQLSFINISFELFLMNP